MRRQHAESGDRILQPPPLLQRMLCTWSPCTLAMCAQQTCATMRKPTLSVPEATQVFLSETHLGIAYENATHGSLQETLQNYGPFSEKFARFFFQQLMCGMSYLHTHGVAHGGLRLSKLLLRVYSTANGAAPVLKISGFANAVEDPLVAAPPKPSRGGRPNSPAKSVKVRATGASPWCAQTL